MSITTRSSLATMAVMAGLLTVAGPATAASTDPSNPRTTIDATMLLHGDFSTFVTNEDSPVRDNLLCSPVTRTTTRWVCATPPRRS
jgi:hypothetical protein